MDSQIETYSIPENFIDESRILNGMFKTRNAIEGLILAFAFTIWPLLLFHGSTTAKISICAFTAIPPFMIGNFGFNGDPISVTIMNMVRWMKSKRIILYNNEIRPMKNTRIDGKSDEVTLADKMFDAFEQRKRRKLEKRNAELDQDFEYINEEGIEDFLINGVEFTEVNDSVKEGEADAAAKAKNKREDAKRKRKLKEQLKKIKKSSYVLEGFDLDEFATQMMKAREMDDAVLSSIALAKSEDFHAEITVLEEMEDFLCKQNERNMVDMMYEPAPSSDSHNEHIRNKILAYYAEYYEEHNANKATRKVVPSRSYVELDFTEELREAAEDSANSASEFTEEPHVEEQSAQSQSVDTAADGASSFSLDGFNF